MMCRGCMFKGNEGNTLGAEIARRALAVSQRPAAALMSRGRAHLDLRATASIAGSPRQGRFMPCQTFVWISPYSRVGFFPKPDRIGKLESSVSFFVSSMLRRLR